MLQRMFIFTAALLITSCTIIPTSWTISDDQEALIQESTIQDIEFARRFETMKPETRKEYFLEMIKGRLLFEEAVLGESQDIDLILQDVKESWAKEEKESNDKKEEDAEDSAKEEDTELEQEEEFPEEKEEQDG